MIIDLSKREPVIQVGDIVAYSLCTCMVIKTKNAKEYCNYGLLKLETGMVLDTYPSLETINNDTKIKLIAKCDDVKIVSNN